MVYDVVYNVRFETAGLCYLHIKDKLGSHSDKGSVGHTLQSKQIYGG